MVSSLTRRLDRLDRGIWRNRDIENMTDDQLNRAIASHMPDPEAWLSRWNAMSFDQQGVELKRMMEGKQP